MSRRKKQPAAPAPDTTLQQFASDFFRLFGAHIESGDGNPVASFDVCLTPELATHFGRERLSLCFHGVEPQAGQELVAHGSRAFDRMLAFLDRRSAFAVQRLPRRVVTGEALMGALQPLNASIQDLRVQEQTQFLFAFTWRITYRADDKRQELYTIVIDQDGTRLPQVGEPKAPANALDLNQLLADAEPVVLERNEEGHLLPPKLLALAQLATLAERARKYVIYHADLNCVNYEAEILPRLHKSLNRLTTYYQQQIEEVYDAHDPDGEKRRVLETDLNRKIAEEVENHRLRVQVELLSYLALETPTAVLEMTLSDGKSQAGVRVVQNRYNGVLRRPACYACGADVTAAALDRNGHIICAACIEQCATCQEIVCVRCGLATCPVCGKGNCDVCGHQCWACGERACAAHISRCPVCGDEVCHACQSACAHCGVLQCRGHLVADCVVPSDGVTQLVCAACAVRCPGCHQHTAQTGICAASGQRFCRNCLVTCTTCGRSMGPGFYTISPGDGQPYCHACQHDCPACGRATPAGVVCATCGAEGCPVCMPRCSYCGVAVCSAHSRVMKGCGHVVCAVHIQTCAIGHEVVCPTCNPPCAICERAHCAEHTQTCAQCGQEYCSECVRISGLCDTCATVIKHGESVEIGVLPWANHPAVAKLLPYYRWVRESNTRYTVYYGQGSMLTAAVIVVRRTAEGDQVIHTRRVGAVERLRGMLGT